MGGKRSAQGNAAANGDGAAAQEEWPSRKRQTRGLRVDGAADGSAEAGSSGQEDSGSTFSPVTIRFSMRCDSSALFARKAAFDAALRKVAADFGGREFRVERTRVGPSEDTLQRVLSFVVEHVRPEIIILCYQSCKAWRGELEARGFSNRTFLLCSTLASANREEAAPFFYDSEEEEIYVRNAGEIDAEERRRIFQRLARNALQRMHASAGPERAVCADAIAFLQRSWGRGGSVHEWLQALSQEEDASVLARSAVSTAQVLGLPLIQWAGKPTRRYPGLFTLTGHARGVIAVAFSPDGKTVISGSKDRLVKMWSAETGEEVWSSGRHDGKGCCICTRIREKGVNRKCPVSGHAAQVSSVAFSPDGKHFVTGSWDNLVKIWNTETRAEVWSSRTHDRRRPCTCTKGADYFGEILKNPLCPLEGHSDGMCAVAFSPDGKRVVSGAQDRLVKIWNIETGTEIHSFGHSCTGSCICEERDENGEYGDIAKLCPVKGPESGVFSVAFSPDGERVVASSWDCSFTVWDVEQGAELFTQGQHYNTGLCICEKYENPECPISAHGQAITSICFSPDGKRVVSASNDGTVKIWDAKTCAKVCTLDLHQSDEVKSVAFSLDGKRVVSGAGDSLIKIWDVEMGAVVRTLAGHSDEVQAIAISPDGKRVVSGSDDGLVKIWNAETGPEEGKEAEHCSGAVACVIFSPDGKLVVSRTGDSCLRLWNAASGAEVLTIGHSCTGSCLCTMQDQGQYHWATLIVHPECPKSGHTLGVVSFAFSPDGKRVVSGSTDRLVKIWDVATGAEVRTLTGHGKTVTSVAFSPDGQRVVSGSSDKLVKIWDVETGQEVWTSMTHDRTHPCTCTNQIRWSGIGATVWNPECPLPGHFAGVHSVGFSPDGKRVVSVSEDRVAKIWCSFTGAQVCTLTGVRAVSFSPDGKRVVSASKDHLVQIWNARTGSKVCTLRGHKKSVRQVQFTEDGDQVISGSLDNTVRVWDIATRREVRKVAGTTFALAPAQLANPTTNHQHFLTVSKASEQQRSGVHLNGADRLHVFDLQEGAAAAPVASFVAPAPVATVGWHGAAIWLGSSNGAMSFLQAPFLQTTHTADCEGISNNP